MKKKLLLILIALLCCMSGMWAQTFYAEYKDGTLTFYYDSYSSSRTGTIYTAVRAKNLPSSSWGEKAGQITSVVFDSSVANYHDLTTTASWFKSCTKLTEVKGLSNLYTYNVTDMSYMFDYCSSLENIDLSGFYTGNVTNMTAMFENCKKLVSLDLSSFNTSKVQYMRLMFYGCSILSDIYVGTGWSTASATSYDSMFWGCDNLVGEDYTQYSSSAQSGAKAHYGAGGYLRNVATKNAARAYAVLNDGTLSFYNDNSSASRQGTVYKAFRNSESGSWGSQATTITAVGFDSSFSGFSQLASTKYWFYGCTALTTLGGFENLNTANVTDMSYMFGECTGLTSLDLSGFNTANVTDMNHMFYNCSALTELDLSMMNTSGVTDMSYMFSGCGKLVSVYAGSKWSTAAVAEGEDMFSACYALVGEDYTQNDYYSDDATLAHYGAGGYLRNIATKGSARAYAVFSDGTLTFYCDALASTRTGTLYQTFRTLYYSSWNEKAASITAVQTDESFASFSGLKTTAFWFDGLTNLTDVSLRGFNTSNVADMRYMFRECINLTSLDLSGFDTGSVTDMSGMFYFCSKLVSIYAGSKWTTEGVTYSTSMFYRCESIVGNDGTTYDSSATNASKAHYGEGGYLCKAKQPYAVLNGGTLTFYYDYENREGTVYDTFRTSSSDSWGAQASEITSVVFDESFADYDALENTSCWFQGCSKLVSVTGVENLNTEYVTDMSQMFSNCTALKTLDLSGFNTSSVQLMSMMFSGCTSLEFLALTGFNTENVLVMSNMFEECSSLTSLSLNWFVTDNVYNMDYMFYGCSSLEYIGVSEGWNTDNVIYGDMMFEECSSLEGEDGTKYDYMYTDVAKAHYGEGGYLTYIYKGGNSVTTNSAGWASFAPKYDCTIAEGAEAYSVTAVNESTSTVTAETVDYMEVGSGYLVKGEPNTKYDVTKYSGGMKAKALFAPEATKSLPVDGGATMVPCLEKIIIDSEKLPVFPLPGVDYSYYVLGEKDGKAGLYLVDGKLTVPAGKAYLSVWSGGGKAKELTIVIGGDETGVTDVNENEDGSGVAKIIRNGSLVIERGNEVYSISGTRKK